MTNIPFDDDNLIPPDVVQAIERGGAMMALALKVREIILQKFTKEQLEEMPFHQSTLEVGKMLLKAEGLSDDDCARLIGIGGSKLLASLALADKMVDALKAEIGKPDSDYQKNN
jgi:hypothetical protein